MIHDILSFSDEGARSLKLLYEGNDRFVRGLRSIESIASITKLRELTEKGQAPFAIILTCSDSRVPTEIVFDRGLGDLFVLRVAGNVTSSDIIASIEYAATFLKTPLCVVMGHTLCGAVGAAVDFSPSTHPTSASNDLVSLINKIVPAVAESKTDLEGAGEKEALVRLTTINNIKRSTELIATSSKPIQGLIQARKFSLIGALYDMHTGKVEFDLQEEKRHLVVSILDNRRTPKNHAV